MQNSPLLVTKTNAMNNSKLPTNQKPNKQASEPFEKVLSKQVKHNEAKVPDTSQQERKAEERGGVKEAGSNNAQANPKKADVNSKRAILSDNPIVIAEEVLQALAEGAAIKDGVEKAVDAQSLAMETTSKALEDVTDGEVTMQTGQDVNVVQLPLSSTVATNGNAADQFFANKTKVSTTESAEITEQLKQPVSEFSKAAIPDDEVNHVGDRLHANTMQNKPLKEASEILNPKFADAFVNEGKQLAAVEEVVNNIKLAADITAVATQTSVVKPAAIMTPSALQAGASNMITASPGRTGWNEAISQKVIWMIGATEQSATLTLNPKDLGPLQVVINVNNEKAEATFISENPEVRKALEEGMSTLRNAMGQTGIELGQANVNTSKQHQDFQEANKEHLASQANRSGVEEGAEQVNQQPLNIRISNGLVDTFV